MLSTRRRRAPADERGAPPEHETRSLAAGRRHRPEGSGGGHLSCVEGFDVRVKSAMASLSRPIHGVMIVG